MFKVIVGIIFQKLLKRYKYLRRKILFLIKKYLKNTLQIVLKLLNKLVLTIFKKS